jgi:hypothetical protein
MSLAARAYRTARDRFEGSAEGARAAFALGRMAADQERDPAGAARWFHRYLDEAPSGAFAQEAAGRLIDAHRLAGDRAEARQAAHAYLERFPDGPYAELAQSLAEP